MTTHELDERQRKIIAMWNEGHSSGSIGRALGITRNAAIGVVHRMQRRGYATRKGSPSLSIRPVNPNPHPAIKMVRPEPVKPKPPKAQPKEVFDQPPVPIISCDTDGCRFAVKWDQRAQRHLFCNKPSVPHHPFCEKHYGIAHEKRK